MQTITSKNTSVNKLAGFYKKAIQHGYIKKNDYVLDYGCGKNIAYTMDFAANNGFRVAGFDPYHMTSDYNNTSLEHSNMQHVTMVACNNVLNVLTDEAMVNVLLALQDLAIDYALTIHFTVYEGDRTGQGRTTMQDCYQRNQRIADYVKVIELYFNHVSVKHGIIKAAI